MTSMTTKTRYPLSSHELILQTPANPYTAQIFMRGTSSTTYSLRFQIKVTFGHKLRYEKEVTFGEISLKLCRTNWSVARNNVNVVVHDLPS